MERSFARLLLDWNTLKKTDEKADDIVVTAEPSATQKPSTDKENTATKKPSTDRENTATKKPHQRAVKILLRKIRS